MDRRAGSGAVGPRDARLILADTSAWVEFLRGTDTPETIAIRDRWPDRIAITEPVLMELLSGSLSEQGSRRLERMLSPPPMLALDARIDFVVAARTYRILRRAGFTMRNQLDCLIAAVATRHDVPVLHRDADFDRIAEYDQVEVYQPRL